MNGFKNAPMKAFVRRFLGAALLCLGARGLAAAAAPLMAHVDSPLASATFVNIYWDSSWDADNPTLKRMAVDAVTKAVVQSTYFGGLSEYGVKSVSFGGSLLPNKKCSQKPPTKVGFYDPVNTSIAGFVQCEHDNEPSLQAAGVAYNVILPASSLESDFWSSNFCVGPNADGAWHYHGLEKISVFPPNSPFGGGPVYTILQANPACLSGPSSFFATMTHEMVEALTDPSPVDISIIPPHGSVENQNEIGDVCEGNQPTPNAGTPFAFVDASGKSPVSVQLSNYWSNKKQTCLSFTDTTQPSFAASSGLTLTNFGPSVALTAKGAGFGSTTNGAGMLTLIDNTDGWQAGNLINLNTIQFGAVSWSATQVSGSGLTGLGSFPVTASGASLTTWVCNPNSLNCVSQNSVFCPTGQTWNTTRDGGMCCPPGTFDPANGGQCDLHCPSGQVFNRRQDVCCASGQTLDAQSNCVCPATQVVTNGACACPGNQLWYNGACACGTNAASLGVTQVNGVCTCPNNGQFQLQPFQGTFPNTVRCLPASTGSTSGGGGGGGCVGARCNCGRNGFPPCPIELAPKAQENH